MKLKIIIGIIIMLLFCFCAISLAEYRGIQLHYENCPTSGIATATHDIRGITGKPVALSASFKTNNVAITSGSTVTVSVATIPLTGSCLYDAKTILSSTNITSGFTYNTLGTTLYLYSDTVRLSVTNASRTGIDVNVFIILDKP